MAGTPWNGRRVLVTGATGMVGSHLVRRLQAAGAEVVAMVRDVDPQTEFYRAGLDRRSRVVNGALEDYATVERAVSENEVDAVFHLGAQTLVGTARRSPLLTFESNIRGTYHVLEACRQHAAVVRCVIVASSDKAYGECPALPYREDTPLGGRYPYDVSKTCTDLVAQSYRHTYGLPIAIARCGNIYGPGDLNWSRIVPGTIRSALGGERPVIRSDGKFIRDYLYLNDVAEAYLAMAERIEDPRVAGGAFNFSTESRVTVLEIVRIILEMMGRQDLEPVIENRAVSEIRDQTLDASKARDVLSWRAHYDLRAGLAETIPWYRQYLTTSAR